MGYFSVSSSRRLAARREVHGQVLEPRIVADHHDRPDRLGEPAEKLEDVIGSRRIDARLDLDQCVAERRPHMIERLPGTHRRRAEHQIGPNVLIAEVLLHPRGGTDPPRRERPVVIGELSVVPARLRVAQEVERAHRQPGPAAVATATPTTPAAR